MKNLINKIIRKEKWYITVFFFTMCFLIFSYQFREDPYEKEYRLLIKDYNRVVSKYFKKFEGLNHNKIVKKMIDEDYGNAVAYNLEKFEGLNKYTANKLIKAGHGWAVVNNFEKFENLHYTDVSNKIIDESSEDLNKYIANKLIDEGNGNWVADNLEKFEGLNHTDIANNIIESDKVCKGWGGYIQLREV